MLSAPSPFVVESTATSERRRFSIPERTCHYLGQVPQALCTTLSVYSISLKLHLGNSYVKFPATSLFAMGDRVNQRLALWHIQLLLGCSLLNFRLCTLLAADVLECTIQLTLTSDVGGICSCVNLGCFGDADYSTHTDRQQLPFTGRNIRVLLQDSVYKNQFLLECFSHVQFSKMWACWSGGSSSLSSNSSS